MKTPLKACSCVMGFSISIAAMSQTGVDPSKPTLRPGVSVVLAKTRNATAIPDADREDAFVVTIMRNGEMFVGTDRIDPSALAKRLARQQVFYLKADARTPYADVIEALRTASTAGGEKLTLLTSQKDSTMSGPILPPMGLSVSVGPLVAANALIVRLLKSDQDGPDLMINNKRLPRTGWKDSLTKVLESNQARGVTVEASGQLPFADVVNVIDICSSMQATVSLGTRQF
jgi:biopolymer transport protein ExbD/biopolymer transport protein TolR